MNDLWVGSMCPSGPGMSAVTLAGSLPPRRHGASMTYTKDRPEDGAEIFLYGGGTGPGAELSDGWMLQPDPWRWTEIAIAEDARHPRPAPRRFHAAAWDRARRRLLVFGGLNETKPRNDLWEVRIAE